MKIIGITGVNGFIGSHLANLCIEQGHEVLGLERVIKQSGGNPFVKVFGGDIRDGETVDTFVSLCDGVINLAGLLGTSEMVTTPHNSVNSNIIGALNFYEAVRRHKVPAVQITVGNYAWFNTYAITKYCAERFAIMYNQEHNTRIAVVRGLNVYGARQKHKPIQKVVPNFIRSALLDEDIVIYGDGEQKLDLIYVEDTVKILYQALIKSHECYDKVIEAGSGEVITCNFLAERIIELSGSSSKVRHIKMRSGEPVHSVTKADVKTLIPLGGYSFTKLDDGLAKTIDWYKKNSSFLGV